MTSPRQLPRNEQYLTQWGPERLQDASTREEVARLAAFADLQWLIEDSRAALRLDALGPPRADQPLALALPEIHAARSRDGLLRVRGENVTDAGGSLQVFRHGSHALYPHPDLQPLRSHLQSFTDAGTTSGQATLDFGDVEFVSATYEYEPPWNPDEGHDIDDHAPSSRGRT